MLKITEYLTLMILDFLSELGEISDGLKRKINEEIDIALPDRWVRLAARAESISDFERKM